MAVSNDRLCPIAVGLIDGGRAIGIAPETLRAWAKRGKLPSVKLGRRLLFKVTDLEDFLDRHRRGGPEPARCAIVELVAMMREKREVERGG